MFRDMPRFREHGGPEQPGGRETSPIHACPYHRQKRGIVVARQRHVPDHVPGNREKQGVELGRRGHRGQDRSVEPWNGLHRGQDTSHASSPRRQLPDLAESYDWAQPHEQKRRRVALV